MSYYLVYGVTDESWRSFCEFWASKGVTEYGMIAWGIPGVAALVYWCNGLLLLALGERPFLLSSRPAAPFCPPSAFPRAAAPPTADRPLPSI